jgi:formylglycine-generating enzyme required for sulfatase activity
MKTLSTTTALRILLLMAAILPFTKTSAYNFEVGKLQYSITSASTVKVTGASTDYYSYIEIPNHVTFNNVDYTVTAIEDSAFYNNHYIENVIIPESITSIGVAAFKIHNLRNITFKALTPPIMHDSFDQHEKPTSSVLEHYSDFLILNIYKAAYTSYKSINDEYHFFSLISCIDGDAAPSPYFEEEFYGQDCISGGEKGGAYSCEITILGEEDCFIFVSYNMEGQLNGNVYSCTCYYECMSTEYYLRAWALSEGKSPSEDVETWGSLYPRWNESFDFEHSDLYYNLIGQNEIEVTYGAYYNPCGGGEQKVPNNQFRDFSEIKTNGESFKYYSDDYEEYHDYYYGDVVIPGTVTFNNNKTYNVVAIGESAFKKCVNLNSVTLPNTISYICTEGFAGCTAIKSITIPNSVTNIQSDAFLGCNQLTKVNITDIAAWCKIVFDWDTWNDYEHNSNPLNYAHHLYLNDSEITDLLIPETLNELKWGCFSGCSGLKSVTIPNSISIIESDAFNGCSGIIDLTFGNSVSYMGIDVFNGCSGLTRVKCHGKVPAMVNIGGEMKFSSSTRNSDKVRDGAKYDDLQGDTCFEACVYQNATLYVPMESVEAYRAADGWRHFKNIVGFYDFDFVADGVYYTIIDEDEVIVVYGENAYQGVVSIPETVTYEGVTYNVTGISSGAFAGATLQSLILPVTISNVEDGAFDGCHIISLVITGEGNWMAGAISGTIDNLYVMSSVTGIEGLLVNPTTVYSYATVPSTCNDNTFTGYDGELHVPASSLASYFTAPYWSNFINITGDAVEPTGISLYKDSVEVLVGNQLNLNATVSPSNATPKNLIWTTSDGQIATVTNGVITGIKAGECDIKAYLLDKSVTCHVTVTEIVPTDVTLSQEFAKLEIGSQLTLTATVAPDNATDKQVTWASTNSAVATVDSLGHVIAVGQGECFISATCRDKQALCHVIVVDHFIYITLDEHNVRLLPNHMMTLTPTVSPANTSLVVTSSNPSVAAARMANGKIQLVGIKEGSTLITVNSTDGYAEVDSCFVKVYTLRGDVDCDGFVNITDVTTLINRLLNGPTPTISEENADANNDGSVNIADVTALISSLLSGEPLPPKEDSTESSETFTVNGVTFTMVAIEGGTFTMGATPEQGDDALDAEKPAHQVTLSNFSIGQTEVTQALWVAVMGTNPSRFSGRPNNPVEGVTWLDCQAFITQLNALTGKSFRLPTEAEWEYAARGGNKSQGYKYAGSNDINEVAWYTDNSTSTQPVGIKKANELGLYDMSGNVWEWCQDYYGDYSSEAQTNPTGPETGTARIRRGVGWNGSQLNGRVSHRSSREETYKYNSLGLRLAL